MEKDSVEDSLAELQSQLARDFEGANYRADGVYLWFSDASCILDESTQTALSLQGGTVSDLMDDYSNQSQTTIAEVQLPAGQELIDYISATAGKHGLAPFNSPLAASISDVLGSERVGCQ
jgi:hypothetical protein